MSFIKDWNVAGAFEGHNKESIMLFMGAEGGLGNVLFAHPI